jgi:hypothetical protein
LFLCLLAASDPGVRNQESGVKGQRSEKTQSARRLRSICLPTSDP